LGPPGLRGPLLQPVLLLLLPPPRLLLLLLLLLPLLRGVAAWSAWPLPCATPWRAL